MAEASAKGVHYLMKKNKITEIDGWGTLTVADRHRRGERRRRRRRTPSTTCIIATGAQTRLVPGTELSERVVTYEEQILTEELAGARS